MINKDDCPTVPPLYTWDSGTAENNGTLVGTTAGQASLKALALAFLTVPEKRDIVGQDAGQVKKSVPAISAHLGQQTELEQPDPRSIDHALSLMVDCPDHKRKLHCWYCGQCDKTRTCSAWRTHFHKVKRLTGAGKPYSLLILEDAGLTEVVQ